MTVTVVCPNCGYTQRTTWGGRGLCRACGDAYLSAPSHPANAA